MQSRREIISRIKSVKKTRQITSAMHLIAAAQYKKAQVKLSTALPYFRKIQDTIRDILAHSEKFSHPYLGKQEPSGEKRVGYIVMSGDKGLCGSYNHNVIKLAEECIARSQNSYLMVIGNVGRNYFAKKGYNIDVEFLYTAQNPTVYTARDIADIVLKLYNRDFLDEIYVVYTRLISALSQKPTVMKILPLDVESFEKKDSGEGFHYQFLYHPSPVDVFNEMVPEYIKGLIYGAMVESYASEQGARMTAMDSATKNADEMIRKLTLMYNRARQSQITQEIQEIVVAANSL
ncbi:ATP synthase F1 subunit gamma [Caldanaerobius polysaccharolyticus]|uniref:ATP synthase F1 subunit gamma n=1 Tax=Caldanaerobius polysaccharolyticus TaxID=44256 RepID=UPI00047BCE21|nr:ATP synthase F1 subunit gamma [Caldanaerobius polysaccharolyticus]